MVAYSFQQRFVPLILIGRKRHTIRKERLGRSRHARIDDPITGLTGPRFKPTTFFRSTCDRQTKIVLNFRREEVLFVSTTIKGAKPLDEFAYSDGFDDWTGMREFWRDTHDVPIFHGELIGWAALA